MDNLLPTITVLMAEASVVLLLLLGFLSWRYLRRKRQHEAEIETLIAMAQGREISVPSVAAATTPAQQPTASGAEPAVSESNVAAESGSADSHEPAASAQEIAAPEPVQQRAAPAIDYSELVARLAEIRHAQELMDAKLNQLRHDHQKLAANIFRALEKTGKDVTAGRHEIERTQQLLVELRKRITALPGMLSKPLASITASPTHAKSSPAPTPAPQHAGPRDTIAEIHHAEIAAVAAEEHHGLDPHDPDLILDKETLDRIAEPAHHVPGNGGIAVEEISLDDLDPRDIHEAISVKSPLFATATQVFFQSSTQDTAQGWYFSINGGPAQGPFSDKLTAELVMEEVTGVTPPRRELG